MMTQIHRLVVGAAIVAMTATTASASDTPGAPTTGAPVAGVAINTVVKVHVSQPYSSNRIRTGEPVTLIVAEDVTVDGKTVIAKDTPALGKVELAGIAGMNGHEGNLHLIAVSTKTVSGEAVPLTGKLAADGHNRKFAAFMASRWIRGEDVTIMPETIFDVKVTTAEFSAAAAAAIPAPSADPQAAPAAPAAAAPAAPAPAASPSR
ncbi:MAG: hypothetical protein QOD51_527 [Candidatus Eremiobacteraeota bacterium]|nr:hypothetical protein [Candidatus Eremiobacteraeota bacterium]